ncbi:hypothetical protein [Geodermatophilus marinus]|nr:hypothetical protein [Geodermatophilus sp. LHW52908]
MAPEADLPRVLAAVHPPVVFAVGVGSPATRLRFVPDGPDPGR